MNISIIPAVVAGYDMDDSMRMLTAQECRAAMGFPVDYKLPAQHREAVHLLGNAVCPPVAATIIREMMEVA
ncbi:MULTISPECIES: DNA cytosine methyltransferase [Brachymonas]|uniref:DNA cytosine methyltransferase n=1 Tax=Brachymonas TaxID=28219 RepID=UPI002E7A8E5E|nr:DNA cytosine methyltransferase [Brachymonas sp. J145]MEE1653774.1 DNA cytosine methyltransferase [Brachymonas sp. J145]